MSKALLKKITILAFLVVGILAFMFGCSESEYAWRQKMTLIVTTEDGIFTGSSVQEITWRENNRISGLEGETWTVGIKGEAPYVLLNDGSVVVATIRGTVRSGISKYLVDHLRSESISKFSIPNDLELNAVEETTDAVAAIKLPSTLYPSILKFDDKFDQNSGFLIYAENPIDDSVIKNISISIERTNDPIHSSNLVNVFPWLRDLNKTTKILIPKNQQSKIRLFRSDFISDGS